MHAVGWAADAMGLAGISHEAELLARLDELFNHLNAVLKMYVVIAGAMGQQQGSVQVWSGPQVRRILVALCVLFWQAQVAFRVDGIVIMPVGYRRN